MKPTLRVLIWLLAAFGSSPASDWSRWRGPDGSGISAESDWRPQALSPAPKVKWRMNLGVGHSSMCIAGKRLYTMGNVGGSDSVYCLDAETGKPGWRFPYPCPAGNFSGPRATPVLDGGLLYTLSRKGDALCLDAESGRLKWAKDLIKEFKAQPTDYGLCGSPLLVGDLVIYNALDYGIALNKLTGEKVWTSPEGPGGYASPVHFKIQGNDRVAIFGARNLQVIDPASGKRLQSFPWQTQFDVNAADPAFFDEKLFITSAWEHGCALLDVSGTSAKALWENKNLRGHLSSPIYLDGCIYGIDDNTPNGQLRCLDARTGEVKWAQKGMFESMSIAGGKMLTLDKKGLLIVAEASPKEYKEVAKAPVLNAKARNWTAPVLANGLLYCRNGEGDLVCLDVR
ncbi:MAG: PQQ-binding-like beta-propeller repeat protein [Planctomycetes bacterium]|nr:PQQ-binding-like beta-propeller repeat protein [Planctomycetota bacterium]